MLDRIGGPHGEWLADKGRIGDHQPITDVHVVPHRIQGRLVPLGLGGDVENRGQLELRGHCGVFPNELL